MDMHQWQMQTGDGKNAQMTSKIINSSLLDLDFLGSGFSFQKSLFWTRKNPHLATMNLGSTFGCLLFQNSS